MQIAPPNDDTKMKALNRPSETRGTETRPVTELEKSARTAPISEKREHNSHTNDRRKHERRQNQEQILLDTRSRHNQRTTNRQNDNHKDPEKSDDTVPTTGINIRA